MELDRGYTYGNNRNSISKLDHHACFNVCRIVSNTCNVRLSTNCMELHRIFYVCNSCDGVLVCNLKGVFAMKNKKEPSENHHSLVLGRTKITFTNKGIQIQSPKVTIQGDVTNKRKEK